MIRTKRAYNQAHRRDGMGILVDRIWPRRSARRGFAIILGIPEPIAQAFPDPSQYATAKIAVFLASFLAGLTGVLILWRRRTDVPG